MFTDNVPVGASIGPHKHTCAEELIFIHDGHGTAWLKGQEAKLEPGTIIYMPRNTGVRLVSENSDCCSGGILPASVLTLTS